MVSLAICAVAWSGLAAEGQRAVADADAALVRGDTAEALLFARTAAEARCPGCAAPAEGLKRLARIAQSAEATADNATAFAAWNNARAALLATTLGSTRTPDLLRVDAEIARFAHRIDAAAVAAGAAPTSSAAEPRILAALGTTSMPNSGTFAVVGLGTVLLLVAASRFVLGKSERDRSSLALAGIGAACALLGIALT